MKLHEYQAKGLLSGFGVPVPAGEVAESPEQAVSVASRLGGRAVVRSAPVDKL